MSLRDARVADLVGLVRSRRAAVRQRKDLASLRPDEARRRLDLRCWSDVPDLTSPPVLVPDHEGLERWLPDRDPDDLVPFDQTSGLEQAWVRRHVVMDLGAGHIVELGPWLGAMTLTIGRALRERPGGPVPFHAYDRFFFEAQAHIFDELPGGVPYAEGASFRSVYDQRIAEVADLVEVHEGPVEDAVWPADRPISFLFDDVSKTWATWQAVRRTFYRALAPGAIVVEQDFAHAYTPWLHLSYHQWRNHLQVVGTIPQTGSVVLRLVEPIPGELLDRDDLMEGFSSRQIQEAFDWAEGVVDRDRRSEVAAARVMLYVLHGDPSIAADELFKAAADGALDPERILQLVDALAPRQATEKRERSEAGVREIVEEARRQQINNEGARIRGVPWRAY